MPISHSQPKRYGLIFSHLSEPLLRRQAQTRPSPLPYYQKAEVRRHKSERGGRDAKGAALADRWVTSASESQPFGRGLRVKGGAVSMPSPKLRFSHRMSDLVRGWSWQSSYGVTDFWTALPSPQWAMGDRHRAKASGGFSTKCSGYYSINSMAPVRHRAALPFAVSMWRSDLYEEN